MSGFQSARNALSLHIEVGDTETQPQSVRGVVPHSSSSYISVQIIALTAMVNSLVAVLAGVALSVTVTVNSISSLFVGKVPLISPVVGFIVNPSGKPDVAKTRGPVPPVVCNCKFLYGRPGTAAKRGFAVVIVSSVDAAVTPTPVAGFATVGGPLTVTVTGVAVAVPPEPEQLSEKDVFAVKLGLVQLPRSSLAPKVHPLSLGTAHDVALVDAQVRVVVPL